MRTCHYRNERKKQVDLACGPRVFRKQGTSEIQRGICKDLPKKINMVEQLEPGVCSPFVQVIDEPSTAELMKLAGGSRRVHG